MAIGASLAQRLRFNRKKIANLEEKIRTAADRGVTPRTIALYHRQLKAHREYLAEIEQELKGHRCPICGQSCLGNQPPITIKRD